MNKIIIKDVSILTPQGFKKANMIIEGEKIKEISATDDCRDAEVISGGNRRLVPGFIDIHTHGANQIDFNHASPEDVLKVAEFNASQGVTTFLPAILSDSVETTCEKLTAVAKAKLDLGCDSVEGIHLEGPFLSVTYKGAMPEQFLQKPDYELFCKFQEAARGLIKVITLSPELEGASELIKKLTADGVRVSIGHSAASYEEAMNAIACGAASATHTMNAMKLLHMHDPAILTAVLESDIYAEMICDGFHLHPPIVRLLLKVKGKDKMIPITDSIMAAGCPDGEYMLGVNEVVVKDGDAKLKSNGVRAGSTLTMKKAVSNLKKFTSLTDEEIYTLVSANAAKMLGIYDRTGSLEVGKDASCVLLSEDEDIDMVFCKGKVTYKKV